MKNSLWSMDLFQCESATLRTHWVLVVMDQYTRRIIGFVALQSTGVYWIPLYDILEEHGFEVYLVNARHTKNLPGRKSDVQESQWLLKLHTHGLLNNSFQPASKIRVLRTYWRQRAQHVSGAATCIQRMQKALTQMNIQLANVISDLSGVTGQMIVRAIVGGERDPRKLAELSHPRIQASRGQIAESLEGNWRQELIFVLQQEIELYDTYQRRISECDQQLQKHLAAFADTVPPPAKQELPPKKSKQNKNNPHFHLADELQRITGVDLTRINGVPSAHVESHFTDERLSDKTEAHFASWLGLCPDNRISGDKVLARGTRHVKRQGKKAATFDFLGFTYVCARSRKGKFTVHVRTMKKRFRRGLKAIADWCQENRHLPVEKQQKTLNAKLRGHYQYYGRPTNYRSIGRFFREVLHTWHKWLSRRTRGNGMTWEKYAAILRKHPLLQPHIRHSWLGAGSHA
jgi:transposase